MFKKSRFRWCLHKLYAKRAQALLKSASQHLDHVRWLLARKLSSKKSFLLTWEILGLLVNPLATDEMYPVLNGDNLRIPIQMQLNQEQKTFSEFFPPLLKFILQFEHFEKKMTLINFVFSKLRTPKT